MKILVACEYSGVVRDAFAAHGHDAMSCDLLDTEVPGKHFKGDVRALLAREHFDLMVAHPPCDYLCSSGMHWTTRGLRDPQLTEDALAFARFLLDAPVKYIALENPIGCISTRIRKPDQIVQPHQFGHDASKATCLWLKNLPKLVPTKHVAPRMVCCGLTLPASVGKYGCPNCCGDKAARPRWANQTDSGQNKLAPSEDRWKERSRTYQGIANAMAAQWGADIFI